MAQRYPGQEEEGPAGIQTQPKEKNLAAALLQGFAVVAVCTAVGDPSWVQAKEGGNYYVFGVAYALHLGRNLSDADSHHLLGQEGITLLLLMTACCYISILSGLAAFLLDFIEPWNVRLMGVKLAGILHLASALSTVAAVIECFCIYSLLLRELNKKLIKTPEKPVVFGESFFFAIFALVMSFFATIVSFRFPRTPKRDAHAHQAGPEETAALLPDPVETSSIGEYG
ncbi:transmembrane protein 127-like [Discoglossus pictus]